MNYLNDSRAVYAQKTTSTSGIVGSGFVVITAPAITPISSSRIILVKAHWRGIFSTVGGDSFLMAIGETGGGVDRYNETVFHTPASGTSYGPGTVSHLVISPSVESHAYNLVGQRTGGSGSGTVQASTTFPTQIIVQDIGAA